MKRVTTREFLRNINAMTEPVEVYSRQALKGTWLPNTTWTTDMSVARETVSALLAGFREIPSSDPAIVGADAAPDVSGGTSGASRPIRKAK